MLSERLSASPFSALLSSRLTTSLRARSVIILQPTAKSFSCRTAQLLWKCLRPTLLLSPLRKVFLTEFLNVLLGQKSRRSGCKRWNSLWRGSSRHCKGWCRGSSWRSTEILGAAPSPKPAGSENLGFVRAKETRVSKRSSQPTPVRCVAPDEAAWDRALSSLERVLL